ncbi:MAG TPA: hypothetical protein VNW46_14595 [Gemmatimonadaceae bacterium]|nr:hypothetical protein [Gemmatimonadaceae bacterium]
MHCVVQFGAQHTVSSFQCAGQGDATTTDLTTHRVKARLLIGGQNVYVTLGASGFLYNATTGLFSFNVTIQNLMAQPLGTANGTTAALQGTRIFVIAGPTVTSGASGAATVASDSGTAMFTAPNQPYWQYNGILKPDSTSAPSNWKFQLPVGAAGFQFEVEVSAPIPAENSVLRWLVLRQGLSDSTYNGTWLNTPTDIYAVGTGTTVAHYNGSAWSLIATGLAAGTALQGVYGFSASDVWVVGGSLTAHYNGAAWSTVTNPGGTYNAVWGSGTADVYAVGSGVIHNAGSGWASETYTGRSTLRAVWGSDSAHIWAVGDAGTIVEYLPTGGVWTPQTSCSRGTNLTGVWGSSATNVYAVGANATVCKYNGATWSTVTLPNGVTGTLDAVGGSAANDIWITGDGGVIVHYNGTSWTQLTAVVGTNLLGVTSGSASAVAVVGTNGTLLNYSGSGFALAREAGLPIYGIWATDTNNIYASSVGTILHYNGTTWTSASAGVSDVLNGISGASNAEIFAVGTNGDASVYNGSTWAPVALGSGALYGVWAIAPTLVYGDGDAGLIGYFNGSGYQQSTAATSANLRAIWGDAATNVYTVASNGTISHYTGGSAFTAMTSGTTNALYAVHGYTGVDVWAAGAAGTVTRYANAGTTWTASNAGTTQTLRGVWDADTNDVYVVGDAGTIQHWNGGQWLNMPSGVTTALRAVHGTARTHIVVGGDNGVVLFGTR